MESGEVKAEQRQRQQQPVTPKKRRRPKPNKSAQANGGSSSSAAESRTSSSPPSDDADGNGQQQQQHEQGGGGKRPRLVWTTKLHNLFVEAYDSLGEEAVPRRILEKMNEKMSVPGVSREKVASHLQKHKLNLKRRAEEALGAEASIHSPSEEDPAASHLLRSLPANTPLAEAMSHQAAQLELVQVLQTPPADCLSRSSSSIAANLHIVQSSIQQQLLGPSIMEGGQEQLAAETMQRAPAADSGCSPIEGHGWSTGQHMETSTAAILAPETNKAKNAAEPEAAPPAADSILGQFWASPDNEACTSSWDIFGLSRGT